MGSTGFKFRPSIVPAALVLFIAWNIASLPITARAGDCGATLLPMARTPTHSADARYSTPPMEIQLQERFSMQVYDASGKDLANPAVMAEIRREFAKWGRLHIINNPYREALPETVLEGLGFGAREQFQWGGTNSGRTVRQPLGQGFHTVDKFPSYLPLLAHNEILYQRVLPRRLLFHFRQVSGEGHGGRTFVHSARRVEQILEDSGIVGQQLLVKLRKYGQLIRTGFLDEGHPMKSENYVRSWQDRFGTTDIDQALRACSHQTSHFDRCWKQKLDSTNLHGEPTYMLMTEVTIPMFKRDERDGQSYMMFPRIAFDGPSLVNGFREFIIGNGEDFTVAEREVLLQAYWKTREGIYQSPGDILLVDNIAYGHSREPYRETDDRGNPLIRKAAVVMAGEFYTDDVEGRKLRSSNNQP